MKSKLLLHEAMVVVLVKIPDRTASAAFIAQEIKRRELYRRGNQKMAISSSQIQSRAEQYPKLFERPTPPTVRLKNAKLDESQTALSVVEKAIEGRLANHQ